MESQQSTARDNSGTSPKRDAEQPLLSRSPTDHFSSPIFPTAWCHSGLRFYAPAPLSPAPEIPAYADTRHPFSPACEEEEHCGYAECHAAPWSPEFRTHVWSKSTDRGRRPTRGPARRPKDPCRVGRGATVTPPGFSAYPLTPDTSPVTVHYRLGSVLFERERPKKTMEYINADDGRHGDDEAASYCRRLNTSTREAYGRQLADPPGVDTARRWNRDLDGLRNISFFCKGVDPDIISSYSSSPECLATPPYGHRGNRSSGRCCNEGGDGYEPEIKPVICHTTFSPSKLPRAADSHPGSFTAAATPSRGSKRRRADDETEDDQRSGSRGSKKFKRLTASRRLSCTQERAYRPMCPAPRSSPLAEWAPY